MHERQQSHKHKRAWAPHQAPQTPQGRVPPWAPGCIGQPKPRVPIPTRHTAKTTTAARARAHPGASLGTTNATRRRTSLGFGLVRPTTTQRLHSHLSASAKPRKRQQPHVRGQAWAPDRAPQTPQGEEPPWELGSSGRRAVSVITPTSPKAPQCENDISRTFVGKTGRQPACRKSHQEVYPIGRWAQQADQTSTSSPRPATTRKQH